MKALLFEGNMAGCHYKVCGLSNLFWKMRNCLLAIDFKEVHAHFEEVKSYLNEVPFCFKKLISIWKKFTFPLHPK